MEKHHRRDRIHKRYQAVFYLFPSGCSEIKAGKEKKEHRISMEQKKEYAAVDVFKLICATLVIIIHTKPFVNHFWLDAGVGLLTRFAIPYFFAISSYFLFDKIHKAHTQDDKKRVVFKYVIRLFRLYLIWYIIHRLFNIFFAGGTIGSINYYISQFLWPTNGSVLWFIPALIYGSLITYLLRKIFSLKVVSVITIILFIIGYIMSTLYESINGIHFINRAGEFFERVGIQNGLFFGFPYAVLGAIISYSKTKIYNTRVIILGIVLSFVLLCIESFVSVVFLKANQTFLWISAIPLTYFTVNGTLMYKVRIERTKTIRKMSTIIYVIHPLILQIVNKVLFTTDHNIGAYIILFIATILLSGSIGYALANISEKNKYVDYLF